MSGSLSFFELFLLKLKMRVNLMSDRFELKILITKINNGWNIELWGYPFKRQSFYCKNWKEVVQYLKLSEKDWLKYGVK